MSRRLKAVIGNALVWGVAWFLAGFAIFTTILLIRQPQTAGWLDVLGMAIKFGVIGGVAGTAFSTFIAWRYRGRRLSEISWIKFGIGGGVVAGLAVPGFLWLMGALTGGAAPLHLLVDDFVLSAVLGTVAAGASMKLAQVADRRLPGDPEDPDALSDGSGTPASGRTHPTNVASG
ncbi:MAG: hypothetical protein U0133_19710 [Gemmatimonadales bacterium]